MIMRDIIKNNNLEELFSNVVIGLEKEGQRVLPNGQISKTDHPKVLVLDMSNLIFKQILQNHRLN